LAESIREFVGVGGDGLASDLVGPAGVVSDAVDDLNNVAALGIGVDLAYYMSV
jgi:hypothetical protein